MSEHFSTGSMLAVVGGFLDAYTYICRGRVFANAQTGNIVLMGVMLSEGKIKAALSYLVPIIAFAVGIIIANIIKMNFQNKSNRRFHWRHVVVVIEILLLLVVANIPQGAMDGVANIIVALVCALQVESFRKVNGYNYASTMCTGNLKSGTEQLFEYLKTKEKAKLKGALNYYGIIFVFIVGAILGTIFTEAFGIGAVYVACIGLVVVLLLMLKTEDEDE